LKAPDGLVGKKVKCPGCQTAVLVPAPAAVAPAPAPKPQAPAKKKVEEEIDDLDDLEDEAPVKAKAKAKKPARDEEEDFDDLDEPAPARGKAKKPARDEDEDEDGGFDDLDERVSTGKGKGKKAARDEDEDEDDRPAAKKKSRRDEDDEDEDEDRPRSKKGKKAAAVEEEDEIDEEVEDGEKSMAMFVYLSSFVVGFWGPLIIYFMKKDSKFVVFHCKQWLNQQITLFCYALGLMVAVALVFGLAFGATMAIQDGTVAMIAFGGAGLLAFVLWAGFLIWALIVQIGAAFKAKAGRWYRAKRIWQIIK
jgi:uncharacterized Tic20 family protein